MRRIAVINQKGGVGKTTTTVNLGAAVAALGHRVLLIDLDPQAHLTLHFGVEVGPDQPTAYQLLIEGASVELTVCRVNDHLSVLPSHIDLAAAEMELVSVVGRETILHNAVEAVRDRYDFSIIDCPPSLGVLTINALACADEVIIPLQPHFLALQGLGKLLETIKLVRGRINPRLRVTGIVLCMYESGTRLTAEVVDDLREFLSASRGKDLPWSQAVIFQTVIRRNVKLAECPSHGKTIFDYAAKSPGAADYGALAEEVLRENHYSSETMAVSAESDPELLESTPLDVPQVGFVTEPDASSPLARSA